MEEEEWYVLQVVDVKGPPLELKAAEGREKRCFLNGSDRHLAIEAAKHEEEDCSTDFVVKL